MSLKRTCYLGINLTKVQDFYTINNKTFLKERRSKKKMEEHFVFTDQKTTCCVLWRRQYHPRCNRFTYLCDCCQNPSLFPSSHPTTTGFVLPILKFICKLKEFRISKTILKKETDLEDSHFLFSKLNTKL